MRKTLQRIAFSLAALAAVPAFAQAPPIIPMQGFLTDSEGTPRDGEYVVDIELFDASVDGTSLYMESLVVDVATGYFSAELGLGDILDLAIFRDNPDVWIEITVEDETLSPRIQFGSVPYAAYAEYAGDAQTLEGFTAGELATTDWADIDNIPADIADGDDVGAQDWSELTGIPSDIADGDQVGAQDWSELTGIPSDIADGDQVGASTWAELTGIPADLLDGDQVGATTWAELAGIPSDIADGDDVGAQDWSELTGIPADLLDGDDVADLSGYQVRVTGTCTTGEYITGVNEDGSVNCAPDMTGGTGTIVAGTGIEVTGSTVAIADDGVGSEQIAPNAVTEREASLQGIARVTGTDPVTVFANFLWTDRTGFDTFRLMIVANGVDGPGSDDSGGSGVATIQLGFSCATAYGGTNPASQTISLVGTPLGGYPNVYVSDAFTMSPTCFVKVDVTADDPTEPVVIRNVELMPEWNTLTVP